MSALGLPLGLWAWYLGVGYALFLAWGAVVPSPGLAPPSVARYLRWAPLLAVVGVVHPAFGFAVRDVVGQVGEDVPSDGPTAARHARVSRLADVCAGASVAVAAAVIGVVTLT